MTGSSFNRELVGKEGVTFFQNGGRQGCIFHIKNKLKSETFNHKKCSFITTNTKWDILSKNLVTFKSCDGVNAKKIQYFDGSLKNPTRGGSQKNNIEGGDSYKEGA